MVKKLTNLFGVDKKQFTSTVTCSSCGGKGCDKCNNIGQVTQAKQIRNEKENTSERNTGDK